MKEPRTMLTYTELPVSPTDQPFVYIGAEHDNNIPVVEVSSAHVARREPMDLYVGTGGGASWYPGHFLYDAEGRLIGWTPDDEPHEVDERIGAWQVGGHPMNAVPVGGGLRQYLQDRVAALRCQLEIVEKTLADLDLTDAERLEQSRQHARALALEIPRVEARCKLAGVE